MDGQCKAEISQNRPRNTKGFFRPIFEMIVKLRQFKAFDNFVRCFFVFSLQFIAIILSDIELSIGKALALCPDQAKFPPSLSAAQAGIARGATEVVRD